ncbi:hypothetical protein ACFLQN_00815 [Candidatus Aenigmatarchaeota archaeon]
MKVIAKGTIRVRGGQIHIGRYELPSTHRSEFYSSMANGGPFRYIAGIAGNRTEVQIHKVGKELEVRRN